MYSKDFRSNVISICIFMLLLLYFCWSGTVSVIVELCGFIGVCLHTQNVFTARKCRMLINFSHCEMNQICL